MSDRIMILHPTGKQGTNIDHTKYEAMKQAILTTLQEHEGLTFREAQRFVEDKLNGSFEGSIGWYYTTVKLDLEARGLIKRVGGSPQRLQLVED